MPPEKQKQFTIKHTMNTLHIINHIIKQNPQVAEKLSGYNGIVIRLQTAQFIAQGRINQHGKLEPSERNSDTTLIFQPMIWRKLLQGTPPSATDFNIEGDIAIGFALLQILSELRYRAEEDLTHIFGDHAAERIGITATQIGQFLKIAGQALIQQTTERQQANNYREEIERQAQEITRLKKELFKLNKRLDKFSN